MLKRCLGGCGRRVEGSYCPRCKPRPYEPGRLRGRRLMALKAQVLAAFAYRCAECGRADVPLEVHHRDHDHRNNDLANLMPLCRRCHRRAA
jgi:5-methylcytosine-specific restriction endonuclease McrA